jgi:hypothetical protein
VQMSTERFKRSPPGNDHYHIMLWRSRCPSARIDGLMRQPTPGSLSGTN